jgi:hypothetical protein
MSREKLLQANINKLLYEKHESNKKFEQLNKEANAEIARLNKIVSDLEAQIPKPKKGKKNGQQTNKVKA